MKYLLPYWVICLVGNIFFLSPLPLSFPPIKLNDVLEVVCPLQPLSPSPSAWLAAVHFLGGAVGGNDDDDNKMGAQHVVS